MSNIIPINATLKRTYKEKQTEGVFTLFDERGKEIFKAYSLELPNLNNQQKISCIPEGLFWCVKTISPSQGECFAIPNVPFRQHILIHKGNYVGSKNPKTGHADVLGCILLGSGFTDITGDGIKEVTNSVTTIKKLLKLTDGFNLIISSDKGQ
jgi:hypothetical protein